MQYARQAHFKGTAGGHGNYVSQGPRILCWRAIGGQNETNWRYQRGGHYVRYKFVVESGHGIREVAVHDANRGLLMRFDGKGQKRLSRVFELNYGRQKYPHLEVVDMNGKRALSGAGRIWMYKQGLNRCSDNLNILGALGMVWHPDRLEMLPMTKNFRNGEDFSLNGWDRAAPLCPMPRAEATECISTEEFGVYPNPVEHGGRVQKLMDTQFDSYQIQAVTMHMNMLTKMTWPRRAGGCALGAVPQDVSPLAFFKRTHTMIAPEDRMDFFVAWNHRRGKEARENYKGSFLWHEGEIRFTKDVTLKGKVPIPLVDMRCPTDLEKDWGDTFIVTDAEGTTQVARLNEGERVALSGHIRPGGYASQMPSVVGYHAFLTPPESNFTYAINMPGRLMVGLGEDGQKVPAGTVMPYRYVMGVFADYEGGNALLEHTLDAMNFGGGTDGYPVEMKVGAMKNATFFFTTQAEGREALFRLGPQNLTIDLPIRVQGVQDNGCVMLYSTKRPWYRMLSVKGDTAWFQEPIEEANEMWVGNVFATIADGIRITAAIQYDGIIERIRDVLPPHLVLHNPGHEDVTTRLFSPPHAPRYGGMSTQVTIPAGDSVYLAIDGENQKFLPMPEEGLEWLNR